MTSKHILPVHIFLQHSKLGWLTLAFHVIFLVNMDHEGINARYITKENLTEPAQGLIVEGKIRRQISKTNRMMIPISKLRKSQRINYCGANLF